MFNQIIFNRLLKRLEKLKVGSLKIYGPDQKTYTFQGDINGYHADLTIKEWSVIANLAAKGDIGFAEDYRDGLWDTSDLTALLTISMQNREALGSFFNANKLRNLFYQITYIFKKNSVKGSRKNIHAHYDLGNDFYKLWLDPTMTYSSAIFDGEDISLEDAQIKKYDYIIDKLNSHNGELLEIGCGWGGFSAQALQRNKDFNIKGITLSEEQLTFAKHRLGNKAVICLEDYRHQQGLYDHIVSIEMFEAVGEKFWPIYFQKMAQLLKKNGKAVVQTITIGDQDFDYYKNETDFLRTYIFPGGLLPSPLKFDQAVKKAGLMPINHFEFGQDYAKTLEIWLKNFDDVYHKVKEFGFDDQFVRLWRFYLAGCAAAFKSGYTNVRQVEIQHA
jgi:cyclopropane-fatty-acyl-phospholipid synthase